LCSFLFGPGFEEPALELPLRGRSQALQFYDRMEQIGAGCREICDLSRKLLRYRFSADFPAIFF
jgi:hypothetical protein